MPSAPLRPCPYPHCGRLTHGDRCTLHQRPSAAARGYGRDWSTLAAAWLQLYPWCGQRLDGELHADDSVCVQLGRQTRATCVDHIVSIAFGGARLDRKNLQSLCASCNRKKN